MSYVRVYKGEQLFESMTFSDYDTASRIADNRRACGYEVIVTRI